MIQKEPNEDEATFLQRALSTGYHVVEHNGSFWITPLGGYDIAFSQINSPEKIFYWIDHLSYKPQVTIKTIRELIDLACSRIGITYQNINFDD